MKNKKSELISPELILSLLISTVQEKSSEIRKLIFSLQSEPTTNPIKAKVDQISHFLKQLGFKKQD